MSTGEHFAGGDRQRKRETDKEKRLILRILKVKSQLKTSQGRTHRTAQFHIYGYNITNTYCVKHIFIDRRRCTHTQIHDPIS